MKDIIFEKKKFNFSIFSWLKYFLKYFSHELIFLQLEENDFPTKRKENIFQNSLSTFPAPFSTSNPPPHLTPTPTFPPPTLLTPTLTPHPLAIPPNIDTVTPGPKPRSITLSCPY